ncbi:MAG: hypothetical protein ACK4TK_10475 [Thiobacillaceae bacterium]
MNLVSLSPLILAVAAIAAGCATGGKSVAEQTPGKFITYACDKGKSFQARFDAETGTVRIRTHDGSAELTKGDRGLYRDDLGHWVLALGDGNNTELVHNGKAVYTNCAAK